MGGMELEHPFVAFLKAELERRKSRNPQYSLRSFAKDLNVAKSSLHHVLTKKEGYSEKLLGKLANGFHFSEEDKNKLQISQSLESFESLSPLQFSKLSSWHYFAILTLAESDKAKFDVHWVCRHIDIEEVKAQEALQDLEQLGLIQNERGWLKKTHRSLSANFGTNSYQVKVFHSENLDRAERSLFGDGIDERNFNAMNMLISEKQYDEINSETQKYFKKIFKLLDQPNDQSTRAYTLAVQLFPQSKEIES